MPSGQTGPNIASGGRGAHERLAAAPESILRRRNRPINRLKRQWAICYCFAVCNGSWGILCIGLSVFAVARRLRPSGVIDATARIAADARRAAAAEASPYPVAYGVSEGTPRDARFQHRGEPDKPGDAVPRRNLEILGGQAVADPAGSGRRDLAGWLTRPANPMYSIV